MARMLKTLSMITGIGVLKEVHPSRGWNKVHKPIESTQMMWQFVIGESRLTLPCVRYSCIRHWFETRACLTLQWQQSAFHTQPQDWKLGVQ
jgi:hypothetical protein